MKKRFVLCALASALAGCNSEYNFDEVTSYTGTVGSPHALYLERKSGERLNGTVVHKVGDRVLQAFKVEDGKVVGEWKEFDQDGKLLVEGQLQDGAFVGPKKTWCKGEFAEHLDNVITLEGGRRSEQHYDCATGLQVSDSTEIPIAIAECVALGLDGVRGIVADRKAYYKRTLGVCLEQRVGLITLGGGGVGSAARCVALIARKTWADPSGAAAPLAWAKRRPPRARGVHGRAPRRGRHPLSGRPL